MDAAAGARRRESRLDEERLVARPQAGGGTVHDQRLHVARDVHHEVLAIILVETLRLFAGQLHAPGDHSGGQHGAERLLRGAARGDIDESLRDRVRADLERDLHPRNGLSAGIGHGGDHLVPPRSQRGGRPDNGRDHCRVWQLVPTRRIDQDDVRTDRLRARRGGGGRRNQRRRRVQPDRVRRQIAEGDDAFAGYRALPERLRRCRQAAGHVRHQISRLRRLQHAAHRQAIERRGRHSSAAESGRTGAEARRRRLVRAQAIERRERLASRLLEQSLRPHPVTHRERRIEHQCSCLRP